MNETIRISLAGPEDGAAVTSLVLDQFADHAIDTTAAAVAAAVDRVLAGADLGFVLAARRHEQVAGVACVSFAWSLEHGGKSAWLEELYVIPELRGRGVGRALVRAALDRAREHDCAAVDLEVDREHARVEALYRCEGFAPLPRTRWVLRFGRREF